MENISNHDNGYDRLSLLIFLALGVILAVTCRDYGYSYDEFWQNRYYGKAVLSFYATLGLDDRATNYLDLYFFGGLYDAIAEALAWLLPLEGHTTRRMINALTGFMGLVGAWKTGRHIAGPRAGFWSLLNLATIPVFYGHMFINAKDIPVATGTIWTLYFLIRLAEKPWDVPNSLLLKLGLAMALALGVRIGSIILVGYAGLALILGLTIQYRQNPGRYTILSLIQSASLPRIIGIPLSVAFGLMALFWPALLTKPGVLAEAMQSAIHHAWGRSILFKGEYIPATHLPWDYLPVYIAANLPELLAVLAIPILIWSMMASIQSWRRLEAKLAIGPILLLVATLLPPLIVIVNHNVVYDGMRHVLFIVPPFAVLTGMAFASLSQIIERNKSVLRHGLTATLIFYFMHHLSIMVQLHPYQYTFYNVFSGGIPDAARRFETDYWLTSYREAAFKIMARGREIAEKEHVAFADRHFTVSVFFVFNNIQEFLPKNFSVTDMGKIADPDFIVASSRWNAHRSFPKVPIVDRVERMGMTFAVIRSRLPLTVSEHSK
ncbi:MAG: PMT 2 protein [Magnetococcales bacterium]|nr:PMT 2 protein [Magnetococcales bacterium]HIJ83579.1 hypothetical protein [Magnetococcales bacterium]